MFSRQQRSEGSLPIITSPYYIIYYNNDSMHFQTVMVVNIKSVSAGACCAYGLDNTSYSTCGARVKHMDDVSWIQTHRFSCSSVGLTQLWLLDMHNWIWGMGYGVWDMGY